MESAPWPRERATGIKALSENSERLSQGGADVASVPAVASGNVFSSVPLDGSLLRFLCLVSTRYMGA